jgi:hypothetical protein
LGALAIDKQVINLMYLLICVWALLGPKQAIQGLALNYVMLLLNPLVYQMPAEMGGLRWLILLIAGLRVLPLVSKSVLRILFYLVVFYLVVVGLALIVSPYFIISLLKITIFSFSAGVFLTAFSGLAKTELEDFRRWFFCLVAAIVILSLPTIFISSIGFARNGSGFQGILNHPQAFSLFLVPIATYVAAGLLLKKERGSIWLWPLGALLAYLLYASHARTGMVSLLLSLGTALFFAFMCSRKEKMDLAPAGSLVKVGLFALLLVSLMSISPAFSDSMSKFWFKGSKKTATVDTAFSESRGKGIEFLWNRFLEKPLTGQGFGVEEGRITEKNVTTFLGIPISATVEKGFMPAAFLEEVGIIGVLLFLPFFWVLISKATQTLDIRLIAMFFSCLFVNIGEAVFFSPGQIGGYLWLIIGLTTAQGWSRENEI